MGSRSTYVLNKRTLVLEGVTLAQVVELVVKVLVDLSGGTVLDEKTTEDTQAAHPEDLAMAEYQHHCTTPILHRDRPRISGFRPRALFWLHTWAYGRPWYPSSFRNHGGDRSGGRQSGRERGHGSAW